MITIILRKTKETGEFALYMRGWYCGENPVKISGNYKRETGSLERNQDYI